MAVLAVGDLRKSYGGQEVVAGVSFAVAPGECFGLLGPNGAGKTTTLRLCLGLVEPDAGSIELMRRPVPGEARPARVRVGVVPQMDNLDPDFTVEENLLVYGRYFAIPERSIRERIPALLEFAGLAARSAARIQTLSGGMKRRLTLARALINDPDLIFMDEPTTGLDPQARHVVWDRLFRLKQRGVTLILTTHYMDEAEQLCDRLVIMDEARIVAEGSPRDLIAAHVTREVVEVRFDGTPDSHVLAEKLRPLGQRSEVLADRVLIYTTDGDATAREVSSNGLSAESVLVRRASLEDVFLTLTGRTLED